MINLTIDPKSTKEQLRGALFEALLSLRAIGHPEPNSPPDAHICGVIARGSIIRAKNRLKKKATKP